MAQPIYSTSVQIPLFSGLNQSGDGHNMNMQYAWEMENVNIEGGSFRPMREGDQPLFTQPSVMGSLVVVPSQPDEETAVDLEMLFNATLQNPDAINQLFNA